MFQFKAASVGIEPGRFFHLGGMICMGARVKSPIAVTSCLYEKVTDEIGALRRRKYFPSWNGGVCFGRERQGKSNAEKTTRSQVWSEHPLCLYQITRDSFTAEYCLWAKFDGVFAEGGFSILLLSIYLLRSATKLLQSTKKAISTLRLVFLDTRIIFFM